MSDKPDDLEPYQKIENLREQLIELRPQEYEKYKHVYTDSYLEHLFATKKEGKTRKFSSVVKKVLDSFEVLEKYVTSEEAKVYKDYYEGNISKEEFDTFDRNNGNEVDAFWNYCCGLDELKRPVIVMDFDSFDLKRAKNNLDDILRENIRAHYKFLHLVKYENTDPVKFIRWSVICQPPQRASTYLNRVFINAAKRLTDVGSTCFPERTFKTYIVNIQSFIVSFAKNVAFKFLPNGIKDKLEFSKSKEFDDVIAGCKVNKRLLNSNLGGLHTLSDGQIVGVF